MPTTIADAFGKATLHDGFVKSALHERDPKPASALGGWSKVLVRNTVFGWRSFTPPTNIADGDYSRTWSRIFLKQEYTHPSAGYQFHQKECYFADFAVIENGFAPNVFAHRYRVENETKSAGFDASTGFAHPFFPDQQIELGRTRNVYRRWRRTSALGGTAYPLDTVQELRGNNVRMLDFEREYFSYTNGLRTTAQLTPDPITAAFDPTKYYRWNPLGVLQAIGPEAGRTDTNICPGYRYDINTTQQTTNIGISSGHTAVTWFFTWRAVRLRTTGGVINYGRVNTTQLGNGQFTVTDGPALMAMGAGADEVIYPPLPVLTDFGKQLHKTDSASNWFDVTCYTPVTFPSFASVVPDP